MYKWYEQATKCYVYLPDVSAKQEQELEKVFHILALATEFAIGNNNEDSEDPIDEYGEDENNAVDGSQLPNNIYNQKCFHEGMQLS